MQLFFSVIPLITIVALIIFLSNSIILFWNRKDNSVNGKFKKRTIYSFIALIVVLFLWQIIAMNNRPKYYDTFPDNVVPIPLNSRE
jgi:uncharacterized membrane protein